jgi:hypothetical protein
MFIAFPTSSNLTGFSIYHSQYRSEAALSPEEWKSVLKLTTAWQFSSVRETAIKHLSQSQEPDLIEKLILARRFHIDSWLVDTLNQIAKRETPLSAVDAERLVPVVGFEYFMKIVQVRESTMDSGTATAAPHNFYCTYCGNNSSCNKGLALNQPTGRSQRDFTVTIRSVFDLPA